MTLRKVGFLCFQDGSAATVAGPYEVLKYAAAHAGNPDRHGRPIEFLIVTPCGGTVTSEGFISVCPTTTIADADQLDLLLITGLAFGRDPDLERSPEIRQWLAAQYAGGAVIAAVCAGQVLLAEAGLLDGRAAAIHWSLLDTFRERWPAAQWSADRMVAEDANLYTTCGATSAIDLTLYLVHRFYGAEVMLDCARWFLADLPRVRQNVPPPLFSGARNADETIARVETWLYAHFHESIRFEALAAQFGMSWRTLHRRFSAACGERPKVYLQKLRLAAGQRLLEADHLSVDQIALKVGYEDPAFFRALFKRHVGMTPSEYRKSFCLHGVVSAAVPNPKRRGGIEAASGGARAPR